MIFMTVYDEATKTIHLYDEKGWKAGIPAAVFEPNDALGVLIGIYKDLLANTDVLENHKCDHESEVKARNDLLDSLEMMLGCADEGTPLMKSLAKEVRAKLEIWSLFHRK